MQKQSNHKNKKLTTTLTKSTQKLALRQKSTSITKTKAIKTKLVPNKSLSPLLSLSKLQFSTETTTSNQDNNNSTFNNNDTTTTSQQLQQQQQQQLTVHVVFRVDVANHLLFNQLTVSFPDHTPDYIVQESTLALTQAFRARPDCRNYRQDRLPAPKFFQSGANWNRYEWSIRQKEIDGALDPLLIQTVLLDHFTNNLHGKFISSNSTSWFHRESVSHYIQFPAEKIDPLSYLGTYHDTIYDQDGCSV